MKARITITLKPGVLDPQGKAIAGALHALGFGAVGNVRQGKYIEVEVAESDPERARAPHPPVDGPERVGGMGVIGGMGARRLRVGCAVGVGHRGVVATSGRHSPMASP